LTFTNINLANLEWVSLFPKVSVSCTESCHDLAKGNVDKYS
jgi:hypothetical protein